MSSERETAAARCPLLELAGVTKVYGEGAASFQALRGIDLSVGGRRVRRDHGTVRLGQVDDHEHPRLPRRPDTRGVSLRGAHVERLSRRQRALLRRHYLGFVFQGFNLLARTSALENVELPLVYRGEARRIRRSRGRTRRSLRSGFAEWAAHTPSELSGGQQQRVAIARAIVTHPVLLLADEPTGNLDTHISREIMEMLAALNRDKGITVVMVTHDSDMAAYAKRVIGFVDGVVDSDHTNGRPH